MATLYPPFDRPTIILSSPWDVGEYRELAMRLHEERGGDEAGLEGVGLFDWDRATREDPFDDRLPAQQQIPSPRDPLCAGTVAVFGEWIGRKLPDDWDMSPFDTLDAQNEKHAFRLVHPWQDGAEQSGGFPLTGSTFEVLTALAAAQTEGRNAPHLLILFIGPTTIVDEPDATKADWGNRTLRRRITLDFIDNLEEMNRRRAIIDTHLRQLRNFNRYIDEVLGHFGKIVETKEEAERHIRHFLNNVLGETAPVDPDDVFKGLGVFDMKDQSFFFGRESAIADSLDRIETLWQPMKQPRVHWVRGPSGSGKSSFLRAGLMANIGTRDFVAIPPAKVIVRPNLLAAPDPNLSSDPARGLMRLLLHSCLSSILNTKSRGDELSDLMARFDEAEGDPADRVVALITAALESSSDDTDVTRRLVIGFDQFEEAIDMLENDQLQAAWSKLISLLIQLAEKPGILLIATMREDRAVALSKHPQLERLYHETKAGSPELDLPSGADLAKIVRKPFTYVHDLVLDDDLIETLISTVENFARKPGDANANRASLLPLINLTIDRLYREVGKREIEKFRNFGASEVEITLDADDMKNSVAGNFDDASDRGAQPRIGARLSVELCRAYRLDEDGEQQDYFDVKNALTLLAEQAVAAARDKSGPNWDDLEVSGLLRRLVSWAGSVEQPFSLPAAEWPTAATTLTLAKEMKARRLIVPEEGGRIRLVHEAVISHWPVAKEWLEYERPLLDRLPVLKALAEDWMEEGKSAEAIEKINDRTRDAAFRHLATHYELLIDSDPENDPENRAAMREFDLAVLAHHGMPAQKVEDSARKPTHFLLAVAYRRIDIAERMLEIDPEVVNIANDQKRTAMFTPAFEDDLPLMELLFAFGAEADPSDEKGWRPIHAAATKGALAATKRLAAADVDLTGEGAPGKTTPLQLAAAGGHIDLIRYLVEDRKVDLEMMGTTGQSALLRAVSADKVEAIETLIELGARPDRGLHHETAADFGWSALHVAVNNGAIGATKALLANGLDPALALKNGLTPLHIAAREGHVEIAHTLVGALRERGGSVDLTGCDDWEGSADTVVKRIKARKTREPDTANKKFDITPLHLAIIRGQTALARFLLPISDPNAVTGSGATALHLAATHGRTEIARMLLECGRCKVDHLDANGHRPFQCATKAGHWTTARAMLESGALGDGALVSRKIGGEPVEVTLLQYAVWTSDKRLMRFALHNADNAKAAIDMPGPLGRTALHLAAITGETATIRAFSEAGGDPFASDQAGLSPVHLSARRGDAAALGELLSAADTAEAPGAEPVPTPLHLAARTGEEDAVERILSEGWMSDSPDAFGYTPFHRAIEVGALSVAQRLVEAGANPDAPAENGRQTALTLAIRAGALDIVDWLLSEHHFAPDPASGQARTPLLTAMTYRQYAIAMRLIEAGANPDVSDPETELSVTDLYVSQIRRAIAYHLPDRRHKGFEAALLRAGLKLPLEPLPKPKSEAPKSIEKRKNSKVKTVNKSKRNANIERSGPDRDPGALSAGQEGLPGAIGFYPEFMPDEGAGVWQAVTGDELTNFLDQISPVDGKWPLDAEKTSVFWRQLPFYDSVALISVRNNELDERNTRLFYLTDEGNLFRLNGTSPPIHEVNAKAPIKINEENVLDYLRFFCYFVRGEEGPFYIAEQADDPILPRFSQETARSILESTVRPATFDGMSEQGYFLCDVVVSYSNAIFIANFAVQPTGMVVMLDDEPIAADLPGKIDRQLS